MWGTLHQSVTRSHFSFLFGLQNLCDGIWRHLWEEINIQNSQGPKKPLQGRWLSILLHVFYHRSDPVKITARCRFIKLGLYSIAFLFAHMSFELFTLSSQTKLHVNSSGQVIYVWRTDHLTSIKKSSIHFQTLPLSKVPTQGSWNVWLKAVLAMLTEVLLSRRKGTHSHWKQSNEYKDHDSAKSGTFVSTSSDGFRYRLFRLCAH